MNLAFCFPSSPDLYLNSLYNLSLFSVSCQLYPWHHYIIWSMAQSKVIKRVRCMKDSSLIGKVQKNGHLNEEIFKKTQIEKEIPKDKNKHVFHLYQTFLIFECRDHTPEGQNQNRMAGQIFSRLNVPRLPRRQGHRKVTWSITMDGETTE